MVAPCLTVLTEFGDSEEGALSLAMLLRTGVTLQALEAWWAARLSFLSGNNCLFKMESETIYLQSLPSSWYLEGPSFKQALY